MVSSQNENWVRFFLGLLGFAGWFLFLYSVAHDSGDFLPIVGWVMGATAAAGAVVAIFRFHIDLLGFNYLFPMILREELSPYADDEHKLILDAPAGGTFQLANGKPVAAHAGILKVILTNKRVVVQFLISHRSLCLRSIDLFDIDYVSLFNSYNIIRGTALLFYTKSGEQKMAFALYSARIDEWIHSLESLGVNVSRNAQNGESMMRPVDR